MSYMAKIKRAYCLKSGDRLYVTNNSENVTLGDCYDGIPGLVITQIDYSQKRWWQFWKKKKQIGFVITVEDEGVN